MPSFFNVSKNYSFSIEERRGSAQGFPRGWCSAQRIHNYNDCQWQSYRNLLAVKNL